jgi:hypothetical protein
MPGGALTSALVWLLLGATPATSYDASLRAASRLQVYAIEGAPRQTNTLQEVQPRLVLIGELPTGDAAIAYFPLFTVTGGDQRHDARWLHLASLGVNWRPAADTRLRFMLQATRGTIDLFQNPFSQLQPGDQPGAIQTAPVLTTLSYQRLDLSAGADAKLAPRLDLRATMGLNQDGGVGDQARASLPLQQSARGSFGLDWRLGPTDTLGGTFYGLVTHYFDVPISSTGSTAGALRRSWSTYTNSLGGTWRHDLARETSTWVSAGVAFAGGDGPGQDPLRTLPAAEVGVSHTPLLKDEKLSGGAALAVAPIDDRLRGAVLERADLRGFVTWLPAPRWSLRATASTGVVVTGGSTGDWLAYADGRAGWVATDFLELSLGLRASVQDSPRLPNSRVADWSVAFGLSLVKRDRL